ncbi:hypothetical protein HYW74_04405 [Candidatus Pacearchaeota archaeon]|nr:hypothetical protein [Candidatus Pacearchaeota archaeon]
MKENKLISQKEIDTEVKNVVGKLRNFRLRNLKTNRDLTYNPYDNTNPFHDLVYLNLLPLFPHKNRNIEDQIKIDSRRCRILTPMNPSFTKKSRETYQISSGLPFSTLDIEEFEILEYMRFLFQIEERIKDMGYRLSKLDFGVECNKILTQGLSKEFFEEYRYIGNPYDAKVGSWPIFSKLYPTEIVTEEQRITSQIQTANRINRFSSQMYINKFNKYHLEQIVVPLSARAFNELKNDHFPDHKKFEFWIGHMFNNPHNSLVFKFGGKKYTGRD